MSAYADVNGVTFTDEDIERWADEAERGFPNSTLTREKPAWGAVVSMQHPRVDRSVGGIPPSPFELGAVEQALCLAREALAAGDVPVGAVVLDAAGETIGRGRNTTTLDPTAHAEIAAIREAQRHRGERDLTDCTLAVTLEPCVMCAGAILACHVPRVVFGAWEEKTGAAGSVYDILRDGRLPHPVPSVAGGVAAAESAALLTAYFAARRR